MKADAGYGMTSRDENSFVNEKVNAEQLLEQIYSSLKDRKTGENKKSLEICDYLLDIMKSISD